MKTIINLKEARDILIGERFIFGEYADYSIEWIKVAKDRAISAYILDNMAFGETNDYATSNVRTWCNKLGAQFELLEDSIYIPSEDELLKWFKTDKKRKSDYSAAMKIRGEDDGLPWYWTRTPFTYWCTHVRTVADSGRFGAWDTDNSHVGVRPVLALIKEG